VAQPSEGGFTRGFPSPEAARAARDEAGLQRALVAYRFWYPTVSAEGILNGLREVGIEDDRGFAILAAGPRHVGFTANSDTPYGVGALDLPDGPMVIEMPPGAFIGLVDDRRFRASCSGPSRSTTRRRAPRCRRSRTRPLDPVRPAHHQRGAAHPAASSRRGVRHRRALPFGRHRRRGQPVIAKKGQGVGCRMATVANPHFVVGFPPLRKQTSSCE
jgi:hypothetical protein